MSIHSVKGCQCPASTVESLGEENMVFCRRVALCAFSIVASLATVCGPASAQSSDKNIVLNVASLGGQLDEVFKKAFAPFERAKGVTIHWNRSVSAENLAKVTATQANPEYDVALVENLSHNIGSAKGLWAQID